MWSEPHGCKCDLLFYAEYFIHPVVIATTAKITGNKLDLSQIQKYVTFKGLHWPHTFETQSSDFWALVATW